MDIGDPPDAVEEKLRRTVEELVEEPAAAEEVADEGLQLDSANADLWELKSSACLFQNRPEKNRCAVEALERVYALDSVRVDSSFFTRLTFAASRPVRVDTVRIPAGPGASIRPAAATGPAGQPG